MNVESGRRSLYSMDGAASFGQWLKRRRKAHDLTQEELADLVGCAKSTIHMIERGDRRPSRQLVALLADHLGVAQDEREAFFEMGSRTAHQRSGSTVRCWDWDWP